MSWHLYGSVEIKLLQDLLHYELLGPTLMTQFDSPQRNCLLKYIKINNYLLLSSFQTVMIPGPDLKPGEEFDAINYEVPKPAAVQWYK